MPHNADHWHAHYDASQLNFKAFAQEIYDLIIASEDSDMTLNEICGKCSRIIDDEIAP